jgi:signal transduction histidine kinase
MLRVLLTTVLILFACGSHPAVEVRLLWQRSCELVAPADLDGDSSDEFVSLQEGHVLDCFSQDMMRCVDSTIYEDSHAFLAGTSGAGGSRASGVWYTHVQHDSLLLFSSQAKKDLFVVRGRDSLPPTGWDGGASHVFVRDMDEDGSLEAAVLVFSRVDARPRGIYALDYGTGRILWTHETGPALAMPTVADVDGDSRLEILAGSAAVKNGGVANGTSDESSYVFVLDDSGRTQWVTRIGRYSAVAYASPWSPGQGGCPRIIAYEVGNEVGGRLGDSVFILSAQDGSILARRQFGRFNNNGSVAYDADGHAHLALAGSDETLRVMNESLALECGTCIPGGVREVLAGRFSGTSGIEWAAMTNDGQLLLFDSALQTLNRSTWATTNVLGSLRAVRRADKNRLLVRQQDGELPRWLLFDFSPTPLLEQRVPLWLAISMGAILLLGFAATMVALRYRQTRDTRTLIRGLTGQAGVVEIDHRGRVRHANPKGRELLQLAGASEAAPFTASLAPLVGRPTSGDAAREVPLSLPTGQTILARATPAKSGTLLTLEDISAVEYLKRVSTWVPVAQKLAHDIKNPLTALSLTLQRVEKAAGPDSQRYVDSMKDDIDRLKKMADGFMRLTKLEPPKLAPADINEVVRQCAGKFEGVKPAGVEFRYDLAEGLPSGTLDRDQMAVACSNIIENSISAMGDSGVLTVRTSLAVGSRLLAVSFSDTGKGIPECYMAKVFEPYFTLKPGGTGLGMALTKRIIDDHRGSIRVESKEGAGTTVTIELPVAGTGSA